MAQSTSMSIWIACQVCSKPLWASFFLLKSPTWFHTSPTSANAPPGCYFGTSCTATAEACHCHSTVVAGSYPVLQLDPRLCRFHRTSVRHAPRRGFTVRATLLRSFFAGGNIDIFCRIVDFFQRRDSIDMLNTEARNYATLWDLQGITIPRVWIL